MDLGLDIPSEDLRWGSRLPEYRHCKDLYKQERKERGLGGKEKRTLLWARDHERWNLCALLLIIYRQTPWKMLERNEMKRKIKGKKEINLKGKGLRCDVSIDVLGITQYKILTLFNFAIREHKRL